MEKIYYNFKKWPITDKPLFTTKEWKATNSLTGKFAALYYNPDKDVTTKDWKNVTIPASITVVLEWVEDKYYIQVRLGTQARWIINTLLWVEIGTLIELSTYISGWKYKVISIRNPAKDITITTAAGKDFKTKESFPWIYTKEQIPEVEVIKNKKWEFISQDDSEANDFFITKLKEKFSGNDNTGIESDEAFKSRVKDEINVEDIPF